MNCFLLSSLLCLVILGAVVGWCLSPQKDPQTAESATSGLSKLKIQRHVDLMKYFLLSWSSEHEWFSSLQLWESSQSKSGFSMFMVSSRVHRSFSHFHKMKDDYGSVFAEGMRPVLVGSPLLKERIGG
jgi:hypothetical protein